MVSTLKPAIVQEGGSQRVLSLLEAAPEPVQPPPQPVVTPPPQDEAPMMRLVLLAAFVVGCAPHDPRENALPNNIPSTGEFSRESREVLGQDVLIDRSVLPQNLVTKPQTLRREVVGIRQKRPLITFCRSNR